MVTLLQELHPNLLIHLFAKNDLYLSINMAQLLIFNPIICSNFSVALFYGICSANNGLWDNGNGFVGRRQCRHFYLSEMHAFYDHNFCSKDPRQID
jgi:hypothetical protein